MKKLEKIIKRDGKVVPFDKRKISFAVLQAAVAVGGHDRTMADRIADEVVALLGQEESPHSYPTVEEVQDLVEKCLIENGHAKTAKAYIVYRYEHALKRAGRQSLTYSAENIPYKKLWQALSWAVDHACVNLPQLNEYLQSGRSRRLIEISETYYTRELEQAASAIVRRLDEIKLIVVAGPSSSGKTTTCLKLREQLAHQGKRLVAINLDNYFFDLDYHPQDIYGDYDFESPQALDLALINQQIHELLAGRTVEVPFYNFKKGRRDGTLPPLRLAPDEIILIDSLHGMYPEMLQGVEPSLKFNLYIETLSQLKDASGQYIRWSDIRMLRRMVRDEQYRNYNPAQTILHWHYVRRSEMRYIVSKLKQADVIVNSFLPYELFLLKQRLAGQLPGFIARFAAEAERQDAYDRAVRVQRLFAELAGDLSEELIPGDSLLREFLGGSVYKY